MSTKRSSSRESWMSLWYNLRAKSLSSRQHLNRKTLSVAMWKLATWMQMWSTWSTTFLICHQTLVTRQSLSRWSGRHVYNSICFPSSTRRTPLNTMTCSILSKMGSSNCSSSWVLKVRMMNFSKVIPAISSTSDRSSKNYKRLISLSSQLMQRKAVEWRLIMIKKHYSYRPLSLTMTRFCEFPNYRAMAPHGHHHRKCRTA